MAFLAAPRAYLDSRHNLNVKNTMLIRHHALRWQRAGGSKARHSLWYVGCEQLSAPCMSRNQCDLPRDGPVVGPGSAGGRLCEYLNENEHLVLGASSIRICYTKRARKRRKVPPRPGDALRGC